MTVDAMELPEQLYLVEQRRGYDSVGSLCSPGAFEVVLAPGEEATLIVTVEDAHQRGAPRPPVEALAREIARRAALIDAAAPALREGVAGELVLASDAFLIYPAARYEPTHQGEPRARTIIAGYPWFTDWGRDTMISLEGLALVTGRHVEAGAALRMFARHVRDGLIPNLFPESRGEGLYHTADATLWFFHAVDRYVTIARDRETLRHLLPTLEDIVTHHVRGTRFGIHVDPGDELLSQGAPGLQLTWMDAKVDGWVVTPRRGKAVEINALWYNALCLLAGWLLEEGHASRAHEVLERASRVRASFNLRFWSDRHGHLFDVVDGEGGDDGSLRPNQILALSLPNPVLVEPRWMAVLHAVRDALLTPVGLRSLAPTERAYEARYDGDLRARDAAYHQGTVWAWLAGPFVDAWLRVHPADVAGAREALVGFAGHIGEGAIGFISEIFDAEPPFTPRGCTAQAWSVAEVLRVWAKTHEPQPPR
jgi:predicted glycogen debranching enzyme